MILKVRNQKWFPFILFKMIDWICCRVLFDFKGKNCKIGLNFNEISSKIAHFKTFSGILYFFLNRKLTLPIFMSVQSIETAFWKNNYVLYELHLSQKTFWKFIFYFDFTIFQVEYEKCCSIFYELDFLAIIYRVRIMYWYCKWKLLNYWFLVRNIKKS